MKLRKIAALLLALALLPVPAAWASQALGTEVQESVQILGPGVSLHTGRLWSATYSDLRTERYLDYTPSLGVVPAVAYGGMVPGKQTLTELARGLEGYGNRVLGGVNGDYFVVASGVPLGLVVTGGVLRSGSSYHNGVGFLPDGTVFVGAPALQMSLFAGGSRIAIGELNKTRSVELGVHLFTSDFGANTQNTQPGVDVIVTPLEDQPEAGEGELPYDTNLRIGGRVVCTVEAVLHSEREVALTRGSFVLSINGKCDESLVSALAGLTVGETVTIEVTSPDERWAMAESAMGAFRKLVTNGIAEEGLEQGQNPRTAVGTRPDGTAVFYTIDGRRSGYSVGAGMHQVAARLIELGCTEAVLLDGGGSTTLGTTSAREGLFSVDSRPSDGAQRAVSNAIFLVSTLKPTGEFGSIALNPHDGLLLSGARLALGGHAIDTAYYPMYPMTGVLFSAEGAGTVSADGVLTAGEESGVVTVTARYAAAEGTGLYTVVRTPDKIALSVAGGESVTAVNLDPGQSMDFNASAEYRNLSLTAQDDCFVWAVSPEVGTVDQNGVVTAGSRGASGILTVTAGDKTVSVPVSVAGHVLELESFEGGMEGITGMASGLASAEHRAAYVRFGTGSMRLDYNAAADGLAMVFAQYPLTAGEEYLSLWVYGDESGGRMTAMFLDEDAMLVEVPAVVLDFAGWRQVIVPIPEGAVALDRLGIWQAAGDDGLGTIWMDQMTTANQYVVDTEPPVVKVNQSGQTMTAAVTDGVDKRLNKGQITVEYDGWQVGFEWDAAAGRLTAALPEPDGGPHRVTVTATDRSGNRSRASVDLPGDGEGQTVFVDMDNHWAGAYVDYLRRDGTVQGSLSGAGLVFLPDADILRSEFFVMAARLMRIDPAAYADVELPFADKDNIPAWALPGIRAMYALGFVQGSQEADGLYIFAERTVTRAEAMTILGRMQARGFASVELDFGDAGEVPAWALEHMQTMVAQGMVAGYEGMLRPTAPIKRGEVAKLLYTMR